MKNDKYSGRHDIKLTSIKYKDKDTGHHMYYIPSLDITGYGGTKKNAEEMANNSLGDFLKINSSTLLKELSERGFVHTSKTNKYNFKEPKLSKMIKNNKDLSDIMLMKENSR
jgi:hypothetical protein